MSALAVAVDRDVIEVRGPDARSYLHSQLSQDVTAIAVGESRWSFLLQPTGKVEALLRITCTGDDVFVLDTDGGHAEHVVARLNRFKIRVKADITVFDWKALVVFGDVPLPSIAVDALVVPLGWPGVDGVVVMGTEVPAANGTLEDYEQRRVEAGWPAMGAELTDATIPGETGLTGVAVSFTKGCYPGQELVERIDSRGGNVARHLRRLRVIGGGALEPGSSLSHDGKEVGRVTSVAGRAALGYVGRAVEPPAVLDAGGASVEVLG